MANVFGNNLIHSVNGLFGRVKLSLLKTVTLNVNNTKIIEFKDQDGSIIDSLELGGSAFIDTDGDLYVDEENVLRNNVSDFFNPSVEWRLGDSKIVYTQLPATEITDVFVNGKRLSKNIHYIHVLTTTTGVKIEIDLYDKDIIDMKYKHFVTQPIEQ